MHLLPCKRPEGPLESAPRTGLRADTKDERWEGYWASDERYFARCVERSGREYWYRIVDTLADPKVLVFRREAAPAVRRTLRYAKTATGSIVFGTWSRR